MAAEVLMWCIVVTSQRLSPRCGCPRRAATCRLRVRDRAFRVDPALACGVWALVADAGHVPQPLELP